MSVLMLERRSHAVKKEGAWLPAEQKKKRSQLFSAGALHQNKKFFKAVFLFSDEDNVDLMRVFTRRNATMSRLPWLILCDNNKATVLKWLTLRTGACPARAREDKSFSAVLAESHTLTTIQYLHTRVRLQPPLPRPFALSHSVSRAIFYYCTSALLLSLIYPDFGSIFYFCLFLSLYHSTFHSSVTYFLSSHFIHPF